MASEEPFPRAFPARNPIRRRFARQFRASLRACKRPWAGRYSSVASVDCHDAGATEPQVVLQSDPRAVNLTFVGLTPELPDQFGALCQSAAPRGALYSKGRLMD